MQPVAGDRIAIIGAGAAGIHMALSLKDRGFRHVTIYEASERIGGKCFTKNVAGTTIDFGAGLIPGGTAVESLCQRFDIDLTPVRIHGNYVSSGIVRRNGVKFTMALKFLNSLQMGKLKKLIESYCDPDPLLDEKDERWRALSLPFSILLRRAGLNTAGNFLSRLLYTYGYGPPPGFSPRPLI